MYLQIEFTESEQRICRLRIELDSLQEQMLCLFPIADVHIRRAKTELCLVKVRPDVYGLFQYGNSLLKITIVQNRLSLFEGLSRSCGNSRINVADLMSSAILLR